MVFATCHFAASSKFSRTTLQLTIQGEGHVLITHTTYTNVIKPKAAAAAAAATHVVVVSTSIVSHHHHLMNAKRSSSTLAIGGYELVSGLPCHASSFRLGKPGALLAIVQVKR